MPVLSAAGGVGRSTLAGILAAALNRENADRWGRVVALCDANPRCVSPWPGWVDHSAERGTGWLATCVADSELFAREVSRSTSALDVAGGDPIWVLTDTGPLQPAFWGADSGPRFWSPLLRYVRAAVIDTDPLEAFRLVRQRATGQLSSTAAWMTAAPVRTAALWVTDPSPAGLARTLDAVTAAEQCGLPMRRFVVAINDHRGHGWAPRSRSRRTLLADRVGAIVEIGHDAALRKDDRPVSANRQIADRDAADLVAALTAASRPAAMAVPAERNSWHVAAPARAIPARS